MGMLRSLVIAVGCLGALQVVVAEGAASLSPDQQQAIDSFVAKEMAWQRIPGLAVGVYSRGTVLLAQGYGLSNVELNVPVKAETLGGI